MTTAFDVIVLGAGPAGSAAAIGAARAGLRTAIVDRAVFPRDKLCGGLLTARALARIDALAPLPPDALDRHDRIVFFRHGQPLGEVSGCPPVHLTTRLSLDHHLLQAALAAGVTDLTGTRVAGIEAGHLRLHDGTAPGFSILIGADGVASPTARHLFGRAFDHATIGFALEVETPPSDDRTLRIDFDAAVAGYGWRFPKSGGTTIGVGGLHRCNPDLGARMSDYLSLLGASGSARVKGHFLPFGAVRRHPGRGNILLAGDAAGLVDPITGEGIAHALHSGSLAARACAEALRAGSPGSAYGHYRRSLVPLHRELAWARMLRHLVFSPRAADRFARAFRRSDPARQRYMRLLAGEMGYPAFVGLSLARLPRHLLAGRS
ncbi:geranylgeranyl reductase family protein [Salipiger sp.]|uniref:geranylgeranyl reductase family protein n=1 Tax=Salipiger sp. TaxID=2078585 RepID=UPI003A96EAA7